MTDGDHERTFVMVKPDAFARGLVGDVISRLEDRGLKLVGIKVVNLPRDRAEEHYAEHEDEPFFDDLVDFVTSGPAVPMVWQGQDATRQVRRMIGATDPLEADAGTIRGDYALDLGRNVVHAADHEEGVAAPPRRTDGEADEEGANEREIAIHFDEAELIDYEQHDAAWLYE